VLRQRFSLANPGLPAFAFGHVTLCYVGYLVFLF
jgi:hypothetical protein